MKNIGLVLSGGMGKGAYQIGALTAIGELFQPSDFKYVSAASVGVLNTYAFLTGNLQKAKSIWENVDLQGSKKYITSVLRSDFLQEIITDIVSEKPVQNNFFVPLLDVSAKQLHYYDFSEIAPENMRDYLSASVAMPFYNKGVKLDGKTLYDGAVVDNIPIYPVLQKELDYVLCIYFDEVNYIFENYDSDNRVVRLTFPDDKIVANHVCIKHESIVKMIDEGYRRTKEILSFIFSDGFDDLSVLHEKIAAINAESLNNRSMRITGDVIVTNLNKLAKKIIRHAKRRNKDILPE